MLYYSAADKAHIDAWIFKAIAKITNVHALGYSPQVFPVSKYHVTTQVMNSYFLYTNLKCHYDMLVWPSGKDLDLGSGGLEFET